MTAIRTSFLRLATFGFLAVLLVRPALAQEDRPERDNEQLKQTVVTLRNVGTAMFEWLVDEVERLHIQGTGEKGPAPEPNATDLSAIPVISAQKLEDVLSPRYIGCVPAYDGWGNPIEYRLNTKDPGARQVMGIRSAGSDGRFAGTRYEIGPFDPARTEEDVVWTDGYFGRWPQAGH